MAADILSLAQSYYDAAACSPAEKAALESDAASLRSAIRRGTKSGSITSATKNGVNYQQRPDLSPMENLKAMDWALRGLAASTRPSSKSYARF